MCLWQDLFCKDCRASRIYEWVLDLIRPEVLKRIQRHIEPEKLYTFYRLSLKDVCSYGDHSLLSDSGTSKSRLDGYATLIGWGTSSNEPPKGSSRGIG